MLKMDLSGPHGTTEMLWCEPCSQFFGWAIVLVARGHCVDHMVTNRTHAQRCRRRPWQSMNQPPLRHSSVINRTGEEKTRWCGAILAVFRATGTL